MLFSSVPVALITTPIRPEVNPIPLLLVFEELSFVADAIRIDHYTLPLFVALFPLAEVFSTVRPEVDTEAARLILSPLALIS